MILILLQYSLEAFNVYHTLRSLMYESWPSPLPLKAFFYYDFLKRSLLKFWWNELRNSLHFQRIWIRVPCMNQAKRPQTSTLFVCSRWLKNVWSHMRERCTAGSAQKHLIILIWPKWLWGEKHTWFNTKNPNHFHISRTNNGANNYQYIILCLPQKQGREAASLLDFKFCNSFLILPSESDWDVEEAQLKVTFGWEKSLVALGGPKIGLSDTVSTAKMLEFCCLQERGYLLPLGRSCAEQKTDYFQWKIKRRNKRRENAMYKKEPMH